MSTHPLKWHSFYPFEKKKLEKNNAVNILKKDFRNNPWGKK